MKITEYSPVTELSVDDVMLLDGSNGTRIIKGDSLAYAIMNLCGPKVHRMLYRGKNLGSTLSSEQKSAIQAGTFKDIWLGDYWEIDGVKYIVSDFDYLYNKGDTAFSKHHLAIISDGKMGVGKMNASDITTGGMVGSEMYKTGLSSVKEKISSAFGSNVLTHREYLSTAVESGYVSEAAWSDETVCIPNESMIFGTYIFSPGGTGTVSPKRNRIGQSQIALFMICPDLINSSMNGERISYWLEDVASDTQFVKVSESGLPEIVTASTEEGIRPVFYIG